MKINELSKQSGIHLETIRYYEKMGLMPEPKRLANGYRNYNEASLKQLKFIKTCRALDFSLAEIKHFLQSLITEDDHQAADCKALAELEKA